MEIPLTEFDGSFQTHPPTAILGASHTIKARGIWGLDQRLAKQLEKPVQGNIRRPTAVLVQQRFKVKIGIDQITGVTNVFHHARLDLSVQVTHPRRHAVQDLRGMCVISAACISFIFASSCSS